LKIDTDVLVVGGGIVGAGIFRDLALHGVNVLLVEQNSFGSQTSSRSSKMLHGGLRYLETFEFSLVREALKEKNLWKELAPNLCKEEQFFLPIYKDSKYPLFMTGIALAIYDLLSSFRNKPFKIIGKTEALKRMPSLNPIGLKGCGIYHDVVVDDEALTTGIISSATKTCKKASAKEFHSLVSLSKTKTGLSAIIKQMHTGENISVSAKEVVIAVGPFLDHLMHQLNFVPWEDKLLPSKGIHIWLKRDTLNIEHPAVLQSADGRVIFVIPYPDKILIGTTEGPVSWPYQDIKATNDEIEYLLSNIKEYFTGDNISAKSILSTYAGVRPLVAEGGGSDRGKTSREHMVFMPTHNVHAIAGGKLTTFRTMGQSISKTIVERMGLIYSQRKTILPL